MSIRAIAMPAIAEPLWAVGFANRLMTPQAFQNESLRAFVDSLALAPGTYDVRGMCDRIVIRRPPSFA